MPLTYISRISTEEQTTDLDKIFNGEGIQKLFYLDNLREESTNFILKIMDEIDFKFDLQSDINKKTKESALEKCRRPSVLSKYPWYNISHLRDYLRFRTHLKRVEDFSKILKYFNDLQRAGEISIVKIDHLKLLNPSPFGWRMLSTDIRVSHTRMIVEHYMTFSSLIHVNQDWLHKVYEKWRPLDLNNLPIRTINDFDRDAKLCTHAYRELFIDDILLKENMTEDKCARINIQNKILKSIFRDVFTIRL